MCSLCAPDDRGEKIEKGALSLPRAAVFSAKKELSSNSYLASKVPGVHRGARRWRTTLRYLFDFSADIRKIEKIAKRCPPPPGAPMDPGHLRSQIRVRTQFFFCREHGCPRQTECPFFNFLAPIIRGTQGAHMPFLVMQVAINGELAEVFEVLRLLRRGWARQACERRSESDTRWRRRSEMRNDS